jgi:hypothetical protein
MTRWKEVETSERAIVVVCCGLGMGCGDLVWVVAFWDLDGCGGVRYIRWEGRSVGLR